MIGMDEERESRESMLSACFDDNQDQGIHVSWVIWFYNISTTLDGYLMPNPVNAYDL